MKKLMLAAVAMTIALPAAAFDLESRPAWGPDPNLRSDIMFAAVKCGQSPALDADGDTFCDQEYYAEFFARALTSPEGVKAFHPLVPHLVDFYPEDNLRIHPGDE